MRSMFGHSFSSAPMGNIPRSQFKRSHGHKTTFDAGYLIPVLVDLAVPGDIINCNMTAFARLNTPIVPFMDNLYLDSFFFEVPIRLVWNNFVKMMGEQVDPGDSTDYLIPQMPAPVGGYAVHSLSDYIGCMRPGVSGYSHNSLWHRAYNLIWNEWFRDQNLQDSVVVDKDDGPDTDTDYVLLRRGRRHDYFTSCLPWPQKGPAIDLPLGTEAPVLGISKKSDQFNDTGAVGFETGAAGSTTTFARAGQATYGGNDTTWYFESDNPSGATGYPYIRADLTNATAATINQLRQAFQLQRLYERDARGGTRYSEIIRAHFGVISPDARLQRPLYLGGSSTPVNIHPIAQTSSTDATSPQGNLAAMGTATAHGHGFTRSFSEHSLILGLISVRADQTYQQGLDRMFSYRTRWDLYWPSLANIGEQAVLNQEIFLTGVGANDEGVFGYQERYAEMRYKPSRVSGLFRSDAASSLDIWHLAQDYSGLPTLNSTFIQEDPPVDRVIATPNQPHFKIDVNFNYIHTRPMPTWGVPGLIDKF